MQIRPSLALPLTILMTLPADGELGVDLSASEEEDAPENLMRGGGRACPNQPRPASLRML